MVRTETDRRPACGPGGWRRAWTRETEGGWRRAWTRETGQRTKGTLSCGVFLTEEEEEEDSNTNHSFEELLYRMKQYSHVHGEELHLDTSQTPPSMQDTSVEVFGADMAVMQPQLLQPSLQRTAHQ